MRYSYVSLVHQRLAPGVLLLRHPMAKVRLEAEKQEFIELLHQYTSMPSWKSP
ncbi:hypothetical protein [Hymenobacter norwichensis]|uniref:hypothetical protein n=1 Tax=Hymenobacter norwichensis TaxID=223903 RepID=UPI0004003197|nr:hypothetical protein [Hymenobacter norwichensis]